MVISGRWHRLLLKEEIIRFFLYVPKVLPMASELLLQCFIVLSFPAKPNR